MGQAIEQEALARHHEVVARIDLANYEDLASVPSLGAEVVIEFTHPDSFWKNLATVLPMGIPMVSGTTGWHDRKEEVKHKVASAKAGFLYASNFSIGVNVLFLLNRTLARLMNRYPEYDCFIEEQHHRHKADAPSGTALSLGQQMLEELDRKTRMASEELRHRPPEQEELSIGYIRSGDIKGTHRVTYTSEIDAISLEHQAFNRRGFALGAVIAAEWMQGKTGFYEFQEVFKG